MATSSSSSGAFMLGRRPVGFISASSVSVLGRMCRMQASTCSSSRPLKAGTGSMPVGTRSKFCGVKPSAQSTKSETEGRQQVTCMALVTPEVARIGIAVYGALIGVGGVGAFLKSGSKPSLISGVVSGILLAVAYAKDNVTAALVLAAVLAVVFSLRVVKTKKFIPSGLLLVISAAAAAFFAASIYG